MWSPDTKKRADKIQIKTKEMEATNDARSEMSCWAEQEHKWTNLSQDLLM